MSHSLENCEQEGIASEKAFKKNHFTMSRTEIGSSFLKMETCENAVSSKDERSHEKFFLRYIISQFMNR